MTTGLRARARAARERPHTRAHARTGPTLRWRRRVPQHPEHTLPRPHARRPTRWGRAHARARVRTFPRRGRTASSGTRARFSSSDAHACLGAKGRRSASASSTPAGDSRGVAKGVGRRSLGEPAAGSMRAGSVRRAPVMRRAAWRSAGAGAFARAPASLCVRGPADEYVRMCCRSAVGARASYAPGGALARRSRATVPAAAVADLSDVAAEPPPSAPKSEPSVSLSHLVCSSIDALRKSSTCLRSLDTVEVPSSSSRAQPMAATAGNVKCVGEEAHVRVRARVRVVSAASQRRARRGGGRIARATAPPHALVSRVARGVPRAGRVAFVDVRDQSAKVDRHRRGRVVVVGARDSSLVPALLAATQHHVSERSHNEKQRRRVGAKARGRQAQRARDPPARRCGGGSREAEEGARTATARADPPARAQPPQPPLSLARTSRPRPRSQRRAASEGREGEGRGRRAARRRPLARSFAARRVPYASTRPHPPPLPSPCLAGLRLARRALMRVPHIKLHHNHKGHSLQYDFQQIFVTPNWVFSPFLSVNADDDEVKLHVCVPYDASNVRHFCV